MIKGLCELCSPKQWKTISTEMLVDAGYPVYGANGVIGFYSEYNHEEKTLLITCRGATCGTLNICEPYSYVNGNAMALDNLSREVNIHYLYYYLLHRGFSDVITGSAQPQIVRQSLEKVRIEYPVLDKQKEIIGVLDKVSDLISLRKQQLEKLDELVKARFVELFGDTKSNEHKWKTLPLYKVLESGSSVSYGIVQTGDDIEGGVPVFRPMDIAGGKIPRREQLKRTTSDISNQYSRTLLKGYELLITVRGSVGETFRITSEFAGCNVGRNIVPLRFDTAIVDYSFMQHFFAQEGTKQVLESMTKGIALQGLNMSEFRGIDVIIPDISLQQQFSAFVEQTDKSKLAIQKSLEQLETLKKALMQQYFG